MNGLDPPPHEVQVRFEIVPRVAIRPAAGRLLPARIEGRVKIRQLDEIRRQDLKDRQAVCAMDIVQRREHGRIYRRTAISGIRKRLRRAINGATCTGKRVSARRAVRSAIDSPRDQPIRGLSGLFVRVLKDKIRPLKALIASRTSRRSSSDMWPSLIAAMASAHSLTALTVASSNAS